MIPRTIPGKRVLIVEDEPLVAMHRDDALSNLGCELAGSARTAAQAIRLLEARPVDSAVLDINLGPTETSYAAADALMARGIPFTFLTGYSEAQSKRLIATDRACKSRSAKQRCCRRSSRHSPGPRM